MKNLKKKVSSTLQLTFSRSIMCGHPWPVPLLVYQEKLNDMALRAVGKIVGGLIIAVALIIVLLVNLKSAAVMAGFLLLWLLEGYVNYLVQSRKTMKIIPHYIDQLAGNQEFIDLATILFPKEGKRIIYDSDGGVNTTSEEFKKLHEIKYGGPRPDNAILLGAVGRLGREIRIDFWTTREVMKYLKALGYPPQE